MLRSLRAAGTVLFTGGAGSAGAGTGGAGGSVFTGTVPAALFGFAGAGGVAVAGGVVCSVSSAFAIAVFLFAIIVVF
jgi:hypothetical protein